MSCKSSLSVTKATKQTKASKAIKAIKIRLRVMPKNLCNGVNKIMKRKFPACTMVLLAGLFAACGAVSSSAAALAETVAKEHASLSQVGEGDLRFLGMKVYDISLWSPAKAYDAGALFAIQITYDMNFKGREIAERSITEMRNIGYSDEAKLKRWGEQMVKIFPDIKKGDSLIGVSIPGKGAKFYSRDKFIAAAEDAEFAKAFFNIWLSEKTSEPKLRAKLLAPRN